MPVTTPDNTGCTTRVTRSGELLPIDGTCWQRCTGCSAACLELSNLNCPGQQRVSLRAGSLAGLLASDPSLITVFAAYRRVSGLRWSSDTAPAVRGRSEEQHLQSLVSPCWQLRVSGAYGEVSTAITIVACQADALVACWPAEWLPMRK